MRSLILNLLISYAFSITSLCAQTNSTNGDFVRLAHDYIQAHLVEWDLTMQDIAGMAISDMYTDKSTGITRIYFLQHYNGIPVYNAVINVNISKEGRIFFTGNRFISHLIDKVNSNTPVLHAHHAVMNVTAHLGLHYEEVRISRQISDSLFVFEKGNIAQEDITASLSYLPVGDKVLLAWDILFAPAPSLDNWNIHIDAVTGDVLDEFNRTFHCSIDDNSFARGSNDCVELFEDMPMSNTGAMGEQYKVWAFPDESPSDGPRTIVTDPADPVASPFGWHDINGQPGAEYTITRGNNAYVYQDRDDLGTSSGDEPNGGSELYFDFPYEPTWEPDQYIEAAAVNLFYGLNYMHDFAYHFGFDESSGNFQTNNYGRGGIGNDFMYGITQNGANTGVSNNAIYHHNDEGKPSNIRMFIYKRNIKHLTVNEPAAVAGRYETHLPGTGWGAGAYVSTTPLTGEVVIAEDGIEAPYTSDGCDDIQNNLTGKIALVDRGGCSFAYKALNAQNAGAIAVIVANYNNENYTLNPGPDGILVNIPIVMLNSYDCQILREYAGSGLVVTLAISGDSIPATFDSDLDNGIIAHEYGHGIACRLAGGPSKLCLENAERMLEGWSDFFALVTTARPGDTGDMKRGFATYVFNETSTQKGHRRYPYSTDMNIMPLTYGDISHSQETHDVGEVWAATLWDMYWALVDKYGWSESHDTLSGNYKAIRLVMDGLKNTACSPGFVDARDAILAADQSLYNGENNCLLWEVFARRGIGFSSDQGSSDDAGDQTEAFDVHPVCSEKIHIQKNVTDFIQPGDEIQVMLKVGNFKSAIASDIIVSDEIPEGTTFKQGSSNIPASVEGNIVSFQLGEMEFAEERIITYTLMTSATANSERFFLDEVNEESNIKWLAYPLTTEQSNLWTITDSFPAHTGSHVWNSKEINARSRQALELNPETYTFHVHGEFPVLRFYHRYQTQSGITGGVVDVREVGSASWKMMSDEVIRNGYDVIIDYHAFIAPNIFAFSGNSGDDYRATYIDLRKWMGKDIQIRFRFGTTENSNPGNGWLIDDIEFMDLLAYNGEACVSSADGDYECTIAKAAGTIVDSDEGPVSGTDEINSISAWVYPNPATNLITVALSLKRAQNVSVNLMTIDGRLLTQNSSVQGQNYINIDTSDIPPGLYLVKLETAEGAFTTKVIIQK